MKNLRFVCNKEKFANMILEVFSYIVSIVYIVGRATTPDDHDTSNTTNKVKETHNMMCGNAS